MASAPTPKEETAGSNPVWGILLRKCEGAVAQGRKPVQQPFFLLSRRKDVENQRQTSKMLKT